jgi:hypothetical protein
MQSPARLLFADVIAATCLIEPLPLLLLRVPVSRSAAAPDS